MEAASRRLGRLACLAQRRGGAAGGVETGQVKELISDGKLLALLEKYLKAGVFDALKGPEPTEQGTPQGALISPLTT